MDKRAGGIQIFFDVEKDAEAMPTMWVPNYDSCFMRHIL